MHHYMVIFDVLIFPDENKDLQDAKWALEKLSRFNQTEHKNYIKGTLSCAMCFTPVSFFYKRQSIKTNTRAGGNQYETMFIENCQVLRDVIQRDTTDDSIYHPVKCLECDLEIGLMDDESTIHFYQVISS